MGDKSKYTDNENVIKQPIIEKEITNVAKVGQRMDNLQNLISKVLPKQINQCILTNDK